ncbi:MAG: glycosyltransferase family 4 protein [Acidobacteria bacterium]|nr:glycosyltransferase family 4 protein [Acidobacteriota bacterium]
MTIRPRRDRVLIVGPLPPPEGGARVSFRAALDYLRSLPHLAIRHVDLPVRHDRSGSPPGGVDHPRTILGIIGAVVRMSRADTVVVFGSSRFCFSYGVLLLTIAALLRKRSAVRFFGGRPALSVALLPASVRTALCTLLRQADAVVVQTDIGRREFPTPLRKKSRVVRGYRPCQVPSPPAHRDDKRIAFACVGMSVEKGAMVLLDAFDQVRAGQRFPRPVELHLYGTGPAAVTERAARTPDVVMHGMVANDRLRLALQEHDVLVFPSLCITEGHPGAIIEAFMAGLPVIAGDLPGPAEIVRHEVNGLIVKTGDADALGKAMTRAAVDRDLWQTLRAGARTSAIRFDQSLVLPELAAALRLR